MTRDLSPREVAERMGANLRSVQRWIATGKLPARRVGGRWRVAIDAIDRLAGVREVTAGFRTVFVANRGEIAARITRTCERLGIVAVIPDTDGPHALDLLDITAVVAAAKAAHADALHPGFGFLAENAEFAAAVEAAGIAWVGPPPEAIRAMGDKAAARRLASRLGIPIVPGYDASQSDRSLRAAATRIGVPLLVKPAAGGGGKGMRVVREPGALPDAIASARREAMAVFGDDRLILERLVEGGRHVEVQVLFDRLGNGVHLGERDCSVQRRHQKILEETPSPAVNGKLRVALTEAALRLAAAVDYVSAGTCEFLVDDRGGFFFIEMNTRLQVEHPVTELVTRRDLVADQLRIAAGQPLGFRQDNITFTGHAVEVRLYAEDAEASFLPATGRVELLRWPSDGIRVDAGIEEGSDVSGRFDPMLAKIAAHGPDRKTALARLAAGLDETHVLGLVTNLRFLRWLVRTPALVDGQARIDTLDRIWPPDDWATRSAPPEAAWRQAAAELAATADESDPWSGGWRANAAPTIRIATEDTERTVAATTSEADARAPSVRTGDVVYLDVNGRSVAFRLAPAPDVDRAAQKAATGTHGGTFQLTAPMPGAVLAVHARAGQNVDAGDPVVTLEAMKMEHVVAAPIAGRLTEVLIATADQVVRGQPLATLEP
jgi:acetyl-CoA/propionyl-CoA carboxylase biotin carboxyl carrier protein